MPNFVFKHFFLKQLDDGDNDDEQQIYCFEKSKMKYPPSIQLNLESNSTLHLL